MSLIKEVVQLIDDKQGSDISVLDMENVSPLVDYMVVTHVSNNRLMKSLADYIIDFFEENQIEVKPIIKNDDTSWILIDAQDIVVHIFLEEDRKHFALEKLWKDCIVPLEKFI